MQSSLLPTESVRDMSASCVKSGWLIFKGKHLREGRVWQVGAACSVTGSAADSATHSTSHAATQPGLDTEGMTLPILTNILSEANFFFASIQIISASLRNCLLLFCEFL